MGENLFEFGKPLDHRHDLATDLLSQHRRFDKLRIFETIADNRSVIVCEGNNGKQFRLAASLNAKTVGAAKPEYFLDDLPLLIDLDRIDTAILTRVPTVLHCSPECVMNLLETVLQNFTKPQQNRQIDPPHLQPINKLLQIDAAVWILVGMDKQIASLAN